MMTPGQREFDQNDEYANNDLDSPIPEYKGIVTGFNMLVMPLAPRKTSASGLLIIPETAREAEMFMNCLGRVVKLGTGAFRIKRWQELGMNEEMIPQVGSIIRWEQTHAREFKYGPKKQYLLSIRDENVKEFDIPEEDVRNQMYEFWR